MKVSGRIYKKVITYRQKTGKYPDKIFIGINKYQELCADRQACLTGVLNYFEKKFMNIPVMVVSEEDHISFDASGVNKDQFVEAPLFLIK